MLIPIGMIRSWSAVLHKLRNLTMSPILQRHASGSPSSSDPLDKVRNLSRSKLLDLSETFRSSNPENNTMLREFVSRNDAAVESERDHIFMTDDFIRRPELELPSRIRKLEKVLEYEFRDPRKAAHAIWHTSHSSKYLKPIDRLFKSYAFQGHGVIEVAANYLVLDAPPSTFPVDIHHYTFDFNAVSASQIVSSTVESHYLSRVSVRLGLPDIFLHNFNPSDMQKVKLFERSVQMGDYNVDPPRRLADFVEATAGALYSDCGSFEIFYQRWIKFLFLEDNPVWIFFKAGRHQKAQYCLSQDNSENTTKLWRVMDDKKILYSAKSIFLAADGFNRTT